jgi:hypothetical protein
VRSVASACLQSIQKSGHSRNTFDKLTVKVGSTTVATFSNLDHATVYYLRVAVADAYEVFQMTKVNGLPVITASSPTKP